MFNSSNFDHAMMDDSSDDDQTVDIMKNKTHQNVKPKTDFKWKHSQRSSFMVLSDNQEFDDDIHHLDCHPIEDKHFQQNERLYRCHEHQNDMRSTRNCCSLQNDPHHNHHYHQYSKKMMDNSTPKQQETFSLISTNQPIIKVRSKIFDLNTHHSIRKTSHNLLSGSSSGCSTQSSSSSTASVFKSVIDHKRSSNISPSGSYNRSSFSSSGNSSSRYLPMKTRNNHRTSMKEAAENFRHFIECYENSLIKCLSNVEQSGEDGRPRPPSDYGEAEEKYSSNKSQNKPMAFKTSANQKKTMKNLNFCHTTNHRNVIINQNDNGDDDETYYHDENEDFGQTYDCASTTASFDGPKADHFVGCYYCRCSLSSISQHSDGDCHSTTITFGNKNKISMKPVLNDDDEQIAIESVDHNDHDDETSPDQQQYCSTTTIDRTGLATDVNGQQLDDKWLPSSSIELLSSPSDERSPLITSSAGEIQSPRQTSTGPQSINPNDSFRRSLRLQLETVRQLRDQYDRGYRCQEAIEKLERLTQRHRSSRRECDREWRANERMLSSIEQQLQSLIGSFRIRVDEIEGWARICPRDTYEIEFQHGKQRQVLRVKIGKCLERHWQMGKCDVTFRGALKPFITCRVREIKSGWRSLTVWPSKRNIDVGLTSISMSELFESVTKNCPILLDANQSGSLKLRIVCHWQPNLDLQPNATIERFPLETIASLGRTEKHHQKYHFHQWPSPKTSKFGINKDLARSLLTLPTFVDSLPKTSTSAKSDHSISSNKHLPLDHQTTIKDPTAVEANHKKTNKDFAITDQIKRIQKMLCSLQTSLEDYGGQAVEITLMSQSVERLLYIYKKLAKENSSKWLQRRSSSSENEDCQQVIEEAFGFLDDVHTTNGLDATSSQDDDDDDDDGKIIASFDSCDYEEIEDNNKNFKPNRSTSSQCLSSPLSSLSPIGQELQRWNQILIIHIESAMVQLNYVGSWILKAKEQSALSRLQADTFAMEQIYTILTKIRQQQNFYPGKGFYIGRDSRVSELWKFLAEKMLAIDLQRMFYTHSQLSSLMSSLILNLNLIGQDDDGEIDDIVNQSGAWFTTSLICGDLNEHNRLITIFNIRAFFELNLYDLYSTIENDTTTRKKHSQLNLKNFLEIALDLNRLLRRMKKISFYKVEQILFKRFNVNCYWIPADLTLVLMTLLYEHHYKQENRSITNRSTTTNDVKKSDRLRELSKIINKWLIWHLEESRIEIRKHILLGLESYCPLTRRASCFAMTSLFKLTQQIQEKKYSNHKTFGSNENSIFCGQEMDCLLYVSMEDADSKVRDEARKALKCLGSFGQRRLNQLERSRVGFSTCSSSSSANSSNSMQHWSCCSSPNYHDWNYGKAGNRLSMASVPSGHIKFQHDTKKCYHNKMAIHNEHSMNNGTSMPNLNLNYS